MPKFKIPMLEDGKYGVISIQIYNNHGLTGIDDVIPVIKEALEDIRTIVTKENKFVKVYVEKRN